MKSKIFGATKVDIGTDSITRMEVSNKYGDAVTKEHAQDICHYIFEQNNGQKIATLIMGNDTMGVNLGFGVTHEFNYNPYLSKIRVAEAVVIDSFPMRMIMQVYFSLKRKRNSKIFDNEESAREWLKEELQKEREKDLSKAV